jgi:hypothetical protein
LINQPFFFLQDKTLRAIALKVAGAAGVQSPQHNAKKAKKQNTTVAGKTCFLNILLQVIFSPQNGI